MSAPDVITCEIVRSKLDVSAPDVITGELERHQSGPIVGRLGFRSAWFPVYPAAQQTAKSWPAFRGPSRWSTPRGR